MRDNDLARTALFRKEAGTPALVDALDAVLTGGESAEIPRKEGRKKRPSAKQKAIKDAMPVRD